MLETGVVFSVACPLCGELCKGLPQSVGFVSDAYWEVFLSGGSCNFAIQSVRDERDFEMQSFSVL